jgi:hypothetical protein
LSQNAIIQQYGEGFADRATVLQPTKSGKRKKPVNLSVGQRSKPEDLPCLETTGERPP